MFDIALDASMVQRTVTCCPTYLKSNATPKYLFAASQLRKIKKERIAAQFQH